MDSIAFLLLAFGYVLAVVAILNLFKHTDEADE